jgi:hypothetical protein
MNVVQKVCRILHSLFNSDGRYYAIKLLLDLGILDFLMGGSKKKRVTKQGDSL